MRGVAAITVVTLCVAFALGGSAPLGRTLIAVGLPGLAVPFFEDPAWRGAAYFRAGDMEAAAAEFRTAQQPFNLGNAQAHAGNYAAALEAYDLAIVRGDAAAQANFDVVAAYYAGLGIDAETLALFAKRKQGPEMESFIARGDGRAAGTGSEVTNTNTMLGLAELISRDQFGVRRVFDDKFIVADDRWLQQLSDVPGAYLNARIAQEHKRRVKLGLTPPDPDDPG